ncbi:MAG TPA: glycosyltransferase family 4 protein [Burkholderiaceae bacterium]|nr:glycosyltransferase family 4 protein [Burkholderiaceae bacterium]
MKVAIVHDWLSTYAGSERVLEQLLAVYPSADLFAVVDALPEDERAFLHGRRPQTTFIQKLPGARGRFRAWLPLMPLAMEQLRLENYDIVISSNHAFAKGVLTGPDQLHVAYMHSPMRWAWDLQHQYLTESGLTSGLKGRLAGPAVRLLLHYLRGWDQRSANGVDCFVANSHFIARRIRKAYRREAEVIHPPVDVERFALQHDKDDYYLSASRLVPYKRVPLIVEAFAGMPEHRLVVIGDGPDAARLPRALPPNVRWLGHQSAEQLVDWMQRARAFVFAAEEDFGIAPVEAQACGTPVIAYGRGGVLETVREDSRAPTGLFFEEQSAAAIRDAVRRFECRRAAFVPEACRAHAESFSVARFRAHIEGFIEARWRDFDGRRPSA